MLAKWMLSVVLEEESSEKRRWASWMRTDLGEEGEAAR
jgi:hypothetical protein